MVAAFVSVWSWPADRDAVDHGRRADLLRACEELAESGDFLIRGAPSAVPNFAYPR